MQSLVIETSSNLSGLLLVQSRQPLAFVPLEGGPALSKSLGLEVERLLAAHGDFRPDFIAVGTGPGSYTGTRVGVALAKALAYGWQIPLTGFCSLQLFGPGTVLVDAKMGGFYCWRGQSAARIAPEEAPAGPLVSPHPAEIAKRLAAPVAQAKWDLEWVCQLQPGQEALAPLVLTYLSP